MPVAPGANLRALIWDVDGSLAETEVSKEVFWASANKDMEKLGIPTSFCTRSKVAVICNKFVFGKHRG